MYSNQLRGRMLIYLRRLSILIFLVFVSKGILSAQTALLRHYTVRDGLPSNVIYDIFQDTRGYIWFCTDQGVSRFDGSEFKNFSLSQGLPDTEVFRIREDNQGRHWVACFNFKACYILDEKVYNSSNDNLCRQIEQQGIRYENMFADINGDWCLSGSKLGTLKGNKLKIKLQYEGDDPLAAKYYFVHQAKEYLAMSTEIYDIKNASRQIVSNVGILPALYTDGRLLLIKDQIKEFILEEWVYEQQHFRIKTKVVLPSKVYQLRTLPGGNIMCSSASGVLIYDPGSGKLIKERAFPNDIYTNCALSDKDGNLWQGTANEGVYLKSGITTYLINRQSGLNNNNILSLRSVPGGKLLAGDGLGNVNLIGDQIQRNSFSPFGFRNRILFSDLYCDTTLVAGGDMGLFIKDNINNAAYNRVLWESCKTGIIKKGYCLFGTTNGARRYHFFSKKIERLWEHRTTAIEQDNRGVIWMGSLNGLYYWQDGKVHQYGYNAELRQSRISSLIVTPDSHIVAGTGTNGLFIIPGISTPPLHLSQKDGLTGNNCKKVINGMQGDIWVCSESGLNRIRRFPSGKYNVMTYPLPDGLTGNSINDIAFKDGKLHLATFEGIVVLNDRDSVIDVPDIYIQYVNNNPYTSAENPLLVLPADQNSLRVTYSGISFTGRRNVVYKYVLAGSNSDTSITTERTLNFSSLKPGDYELLIWARTLNGPWTRQPASLRFSILSPWWWSPWILSLTGALFLLLCFLLYRYRIVRVQQKARRVAQNKQKMAELEMKALRAQINPHFVSNALNSIQTYYSLNDERKANHYMTSFAQFIRKTLTNAQSQWISVADESAMLETYIELEMMRFKKIFSYSITVSPEIEQNLVTIPAMLIQPYVENAITHGLRNLTDRKGILHIQFELQNNMLCCTVGDNGIGFQQAGMKIKPNHQSLGMSINRQRIDVINQLYQTNIIIQIFDKGEDGISGGTEIKIYFPLKKEYNYANYHID